MGLTRLSVHRPVVVRAAYLALVLFEILSLVRVRQESTSRFGRGDLDRRPSDG